MRKLTTARLHAACRLAQKHTKTNLEINRLFEQRYGTSYSEIDEDWIIDSLDYGTGKLLSLKECDKLMAENGYPPLTHPNGGSDADA
ncbi:hypothetical protein [Ochrobactrum sp. Marseille-Q0166]|uniref:hypothetical protein n=1 Tax=Ochrobactrum sp. Marseille-Q0166 TaxID=2761105 RepID=UPI00165648EE|nr:hypothetical protein [Ochrobactrum sp. Marseille-Q0166]MBC8719261.1 hypothetical protein [Ochrobactrum sp. Marseille-Q0166]